MGDTGGSKKNSRILNIVHNDEIWKDHVRHEHVSARKKWPETWGYLIHEYRKLNNKLEGKTMEVAENDGKKHASMGGLKLPQIPLRQKTFPRTTSQEIGWRIVQNGKNVSMLTKFDEQRRGKCTIIRRLKWPNDGIY